MSDLLRSLAWIPVLMSCGGSSDPRPVTPIPPSTVSISTVPEPATSFECPVVVYHRLAGWTADVAASTEEAAKEAACQASCAKLREERGEDCHDHTRFDQFSSVLPPFPPDESNTSEPIARCQVIERRSEQRVMSSAVSLAQACRSAYQALCPDKSCQDAHVFSVADLEVHQLEKLIAQVAYGSLAPSAEEGKTSCLLELQIEGPEETGEASAESSSSVDAQSVADKARESACQKLGLNEQQCADTERVSTRTQRQVFQLRDGVHRLSVEVTLVEKVKRDVEGKGRDIRSACMAAVARACEDGSCKRASQIALISMNGVPLTTPRPPATASPFF